MRARVAFIWTLLIVAAAGCAHTPMPAGQIVGDGMPGRLYCVAHNADGGCDIYRSEQPTPEQFAAMAARLGLRSSFKLNPAIEARDVVPAGVELIEHPMSSVTEPSEAEVEQICQDLDAVPKPTVIHCTAGRERTGFIVERCVRARQKPIAPQGGAQCGEWLAFGMRPVLAPGLLLAFHRETGVWCSP